MRHLDSIADWTFGRTRNALPRQPMVTLLGALVALNILAWLLGYLVIALNPMLLGLAGVAYSLGLRHAFDVDHIAAIDNVTRKLCLSGERPVGVGFFFALGHSTIVIVLSAVVALAADYAKAHLDGIGQIGAQVSTMVSAGFLTLLGLANLIVFGRLFRLWKAQDSVITADSADNDSQIDCLLDQRGIYARIFNFLFRRVSRSWHMYPIGILFGLGFATATESSILGATAVLATDSALNFWLVMVFPLLFTAGMTLMDTLDSFVMLRAYEWAMEDSKRRLFFNIAITGLGVVLALGIGTLEWIQVMAPTMNLSGTFWSWVEDVPFETIGLLSVAVMIATWVLAVVWYKRRLDPAPNMVAE